MVRMSDILKKAKEKERKIEEERQKKPFIEPAQQKAPAEPVKPVPAGKPEVKADEVEKPQIKQEQEKKTEISELKISSVVMKGAKILSSEESLNLYETTISLVRKALKKSIDFKSIDTFSAQVEKIVDQLRLDNQELLRLAFIKDSEAENYLLCHAVNVCIYSIELGLGLGYKKPRLLELGTSALLHDIGMLDYLQLSNQPRRLTGREYNEIKNHSQKGKEVLEKIENLNKLIPLIVSQLHERLDGSGYPKGLKAESINENAQIVCIADTFEAMVHPRPYRDRFVPTKALQEILNNKDAFDHKLIKMLIKKIGIFPVGCLVELNTKEIARVVKLNQAVPLRPVVEIIYEADSEEPKETKILDLTTHPTIYIKKALRKNELSR